MAKSRITEFELKILGRIWEEENSATITDILDGWHDLPAPGYTTVLKTLQIMRDKGLVSYEKDGRAFLYSAAESNVDVSVHETERIIERTHRGDRLQFIHGFIDKQDLSEADIESLMKLLEEKRHADE